MDIWKTKKNLDLDKHCRGQIGPLILWFLRQFDEIHIAIKRLGDELVEDDVVSFASTDENQQEGLDWKRWVVGEKSNTISILPIMPDRPVVVRPDVPVRIPTGLEAIFFVGIPVWVKVVVGDSDTFDLCEQPTVIRSNTWFGDPMSGELCYSLTTRARREILEAEIEPHRCICPVKICNSSPVTLEVDKLCIHVAHLKIFEGTKQLWTNEVTITFKGEDMASEIYYSQKEPGYEPINAVLSEARTPFRKTILKKSLGSFKLFTGI